jgi:TRAP-type C4-dicarboxylate transport system permease small subunit
MRRLVNTIVARSTDIAMAFAELAIFLMMMHVAIEVIARRIFRHSLDSVPEIVAYYYMSTLIFLALAYVTRADSHVSATLFTDLLPEKAQRILMGVVYVILAATMLVMAWQMGQEAWRMTRIGELHQGATMNLPRWPTRWFAPLGAILMALVALLLALDKFTNRHTFPGVGQEDRTPEQQLAEKKASNV